MADAEPIIGAIGGVRLKVDVDVVGPTTIVLVANVVIELEGAEGEDVPIRLSAVTVNV